MALRFRSMRPNDVKECVEIVKTHPLLGPKYGSAIRDLRSVWLSLLGREAFRGFVFEDAKDSQVRTAGVGVSVFASDDFLLELKTRPSFWIGPELTKRLLIGDFPLLSDRQVRDANANGGLNLVTLVCALNARPLQSSETLSALIAAFVEVHRGFLLKEITAHAMTLENLEGAIRSGGLFFNPVDGRYVESLDGRFIVASAAPPLIG